MTQREKAPSAASSPRIAPRIALSDIAPTELAGTNFIRVVYHSLADKPDGKRGLFKRISRRN